MNEKDCIFMLPVKPKPIKIVYENSPPLEKNLTPEETKELLLELFGTTKIGIYRLGEEDS